MGLIHGLYHDGQDVSIEMEQARDLQSFGGSNEVCMAEKKPGLFDLNH